jgi:hypothetical protein
MGNHPMKEGVAPPKMQGTSPIDADICFAQEGFIIASTFHEIFSSLISCGFSDETLTPAF